MCMIDDAETWTASTVHMRRARVEHICSECRRHIQPGETYRDLRALYDNRWDTWKACAHCLRAGEWLDIVCGGWIVDGLYEELHEHLQEYPGFWLRLVTSGVSCGWGTRTGIYNERSPERLWNLPGHPKWWKLGVPGLAAKMADDSAYAFANQHYLGSELLRYRRMGLSFWLAG